MKSGWDGAAVGDAGEHLVVGAILWLCEIDCRNANAAPKSDHLREEQKPSPHGFSMEAKS